MKIRFTCKDERSSDGFSHTVAAMPSLALVYWYFRHLPEGVCKSVGPYDSWFLPLVIAACERSWDATPDVEIPSSPLQADERFDWESCKLLYLKNNPKVSAYEDCCLEILHWLEQYDVSNLIVEHPQNE